MPRAPGRVEAGATQGGANEAQRGDPRSDTADFNDRVAGNLRVDYLLPSQGPARLRRRRALAGRADPCGRAVLGRPPAAELRSPSGLLDVSVVWRLMPTGQ